jgi:DNA-nicking Smr family endonuclease
MKSFKSSGIFRPFKDLKSILENRSFPLAPYPSETSTFPTDASSDPETEKQQFLKAMAGVQKISCNKHIEKDGQTGPAAREEVEEYVDPDTLLRLHNLVEQGTEFFVADTPEYMEGTGHRVPPSVTNRLHRGDFSIQEYVDLHGLTAKDAKEVFENFMQKAIKSGKRGILIVHGRGLSSPSKPVLKSKVLEWLSRSSWRKWVIAFSSARLCDGGAGATYVLLRKQPLTKSRMKQKK